VTSLTATSCGYRGTGDGKRRIVRAQRLRFAPKLAPKRRSGLIDVIADARHRVWRPIAGLDHLARLEMHTQDHARPLGAMGDARRPPENAGHTIAPDLGPFHAAARSRLNCGRPQLP
jgi:hypothetical protein